MGIMNIEKWRSVWFQAVARAWSDDGFKRELVGNTRRALATHFDCHIMDEVGLRVIDTGGAPEVRVDSSGSTALFGHIEFTLPPRPEGMSFHALGAQAASQEFTMAMACDVCSLCC